MQGYERETLVVGAEYSNSSAVAPQFLHSSGSILACFVPQPAQIQ